MINNLSLDFKSIITFDNLFNAYLCARKGKRHKRYFKKTTLTELDVKHELLRNAWQLYYELGYLAYKDGHHDSDKTYPLHRLSVINAKVDEVGRMIGAWIKKEKDLIKAQSSDCQKL